MKDRSPCISCKHRSPGCQSRCEIGKHYWARQQEIRDRTNAERAKEVAYLTYKTAQVEHTKKKAGVK